MCCISIIFFSYCLCQWHVKSKNLNLGCIEMLLLWRKWSENLELQPGIEPQDSWIQGFDASQYTIEKSCVVLMLFKIFPEIHIVFFMLLPLNFSLLLLMQQEYSGMQLCLEKPKVVTSEGWIVKDEFFRCSTSVFRYLIIIYNLCFQASFPFGRASCPVLPCHAHSRSSKNAKVSEILFNFF